MSIATNKALIGVVVATPFQFFYELLFIYLVKIKYSGQKVDENCKLISWQILISLIYTLTIGATFAEVNAVLNYGRPSLVFPTFLFALIVDQLKSLVTLSLIYTIVVRRFMYLAENETTYSDPSERPAPQENAIPRMKTFCLKFLESAIVEGVSMVIISLYTVFVLF